MKILVTGANGFIGKNLCFTLKTKGHEILEYDFENSEDELNQFIREADFIMHLAGINRPLLKEEFYDGNTNFTYKLISTVKKTNKLIPILFSSSIQATIDNDYGNSKRMAEEMLIDFAKENDNPIYIFHLANCFGKWCKPNYNSVVATFCYNIARDLQIKINEEKDKVEFVYIDDVVQAFINCLSLEKYQPAKRIKIDTSYYCTIKELADTIKAFPQMRKTLAICNLKDEFVKKLYSTYLSYLPEDHFSYELKMNMDQRGSFAEIFKMDGYGQVSVNTSLPNIVKGNHWHHTKNEKFLVVYGKGVIRFRKVGEDRVIEYFVSSDKLEIVDIPCGYTHNIENIGQTDMVTIMWANELFDKDNPDTYYLEV